jgi:hypothetical protein
MRERLRSAWCVCVSGLHEHWSEDIHNDGVVGGIEAGVKHMGLHVSKEFADIGKGIGTLRRPGTTK